MSSGVNSSLVLRTAGKGWKDSQQSLRKWISPQEMLWGIPGTVHIPAGAIWDDGNVHG